MRQASSKEQELVYLEGGPPAGDLPARCRRWIPALAAVFILCTFANPQPVRAQDTHSPAPSLEEARRLVASGAWEDATKAFEALVEAQPERPEAWQGLGASLVELGRFESALSALRKAAELGGGGPTLAVRGAQAAWGLGEKTVVLDWLTQAVQAGFSARALGSDPRLGEVRAGMAGDPRFQKLLEEARKLSEPCRFDDTYHQLDFWLGEWEVFANGGLAGTNRIDKTADGCLLIENWEGRGSTGKSFNFYDPGRELWRQEWVGGGGAVISFEAKLEDGAMHFTGTLQPRGGPARLLRMILSPLEDGSVRQLIEMSADEGATWSSWFDGHYVRPTSPESGSRSSASAAGVGLQGTELSF